MTQRLTIARRTTLVVACLLALCVGRAHADFVVVRNAKNPATKLSKDTVKGMFSGRTKLWAHGEPVLLVVGNEDSPAMQWLASSIMGVSVKTYLTKIKQDVFKGDVTRPLAANDDGRTIQRVQSGAGVVGLISSGAAGSLPPDVVVVAVE